MSTNKNLHYRNNMTRSKYSTTDVWPPDEFAPILIGMGRLIFNWNNVEQTLTRILNILTGIYPKNQILTAHMGTKGICDALKTVAIEFYSGNEQKHLLNCVEIFTRLSDYRNYYVHSFNTIIFLPSGENKAGFRSTSARSKLLTHDLENDANQISEIAFQCKEVHSYFALVYNYFYYTDKPEYQNLPELHPQPPKFTKPKKNMINNV